MIKAPVSSIFVMSEHPGAVEWLLGHGISATALPWLDTSGLREADTVVGTLPPQRIGEIVSRRIRYYHIAVDTPPELRGTCLSADQLRRCEARLQAIDVMSKDITVETLSATEPRNPLEKNGIAALIANAMLAVYVRLLPSERKLVRWISRSKALILTGFAFFGIHSSASLSSRYPTSLSTVSEKSLAGCMTVWRASISRWGLKSEKPSGWLQKSSHSGSCWRH